MPDPRDAGDHYFTAAPSAPSRPRAVRLVLPDLTVDLATDAGVFSGDAVDAGTKLLLAEAPPPPPTGDLLDLGCGYGAIAVALALRSPGARVWAVDVNERARRLCEENAAAAGVSDRVVVAAPDDVAVGTSFAAIYSNPPIRIGKAALHALLRRWLARLDEGGRAELVVQRHLGADSLAAWLTGEGWNVRRLRSRMGYRLLEVTA